jgi:hypothetical protein
MHDAEGFLPDCSPKKTSLNFLSGLVYDPTFWAIVPDICITQMYSGAVGELCYVQSAAKDVLTPRSFCWLTAIPGCPDAALRDGRKGGALLS